MENNSGDENSDDGLQIVIESPRPKKRAKKELDETEKKIIESVEKDIEENLEEKAAKANLTAKNVKTIIKELVTNEQVVALVRHAENPNSSDEPVAVYEPKYTRAKTKQLLSSNTPQKIMPWISPAQPVSEVQRLFTEDLQEDSSGDEYVPESPSKNSTLDESLLDTSVCSSRSEEKPNIALRTRSKLSLSHTPLEAIEEAFMPPDITTDMYDMDCDDDVWREFLKTFTRPLDEVTKAVEDEDHDPEYNVLADEEIDEIDREELRADRAVTVSRKEFNCLMAELFEFADIYESNRQREKNETTNDQQSSDKSEQEDNKSNPNIDPENDPNISIKKCQVLILAQQMRQHVQMLTQNFLLSYEHPEFSDMAVKCKEMLNDIAEESHGKEASIYHAINLQPALKLVDSWQRLFASGDAEVIEYKRYVEKEICESIAAKRAGTEYVISFGPLLMKTISNSEVFLYPNLLPRIPFKSLSITTSSKHFFTYGEESLIALFLEQATPHLKQDSFFLSAKKKINMERVCQLIGELLMPHVRPSIIVRHIRMKKNPRSSENPIKFYYRTKKASPSLHYVVPLEAENIMPPCKRNPEQLPLLWRDYIHPNWKNEKRCMANNECNINRPIIIVSYPLKPTSRRKKVSYNINYSKQDIAKRKLFPKGPLAPITYCSRRQKRNSVITRTSKISPIKQNQIKVLENRIINKIHNKMLPDMPSLGTTPVKKDNSQPTASVIKENAAIESNKEENLSFKNITSFDFQFYKPESVKQIRRNFEAITEFCTNKDSENGSSTSASVISSEKDNPDDIHDLMVASSTVKSVTKKEPSGAEKKRAKLRREFIANLVMATPDSLETQKQKEESFADAFFDKLRQTLAVQDYDKLIDILAHYDESIGDFLELFTNIQSILLPKYIELAEEFYLFLSEIQAHKVGKLMPYFIMKDMDRFMTKLQVYFKDQPTQMKKILKCLTDLSENPDITMETIKATVIPLFKGNAALTDWFLQIFLCERPPKILTTGPHEVIDMSKELARPPDEEIFEMVVLPDTDDPYGGPNCICPCHNVENPQLKSRSDHCKDCGLKFIQGKPFIQTGKGLRPATVSFITNPEKDHSKRLAATQRKRSETSPTKQVASLLKESHPHDEIRHSNESDDDDGKKKKPKTQRKRRVKDLEKTKAKVSSAKLKNKQTSKAKSENQKSAKNSPKGQKTKRTAAKKVTETKQGSATGQVKRPAEDPEIEYSEPPELVEMKVSSDHSGESESEFFESSQDITNTDSEDSSDYQKPKDASWTREEDKIILQAFRQSSDNEATFKQISTVLKNRTVVEIKNRFHKLMNLLQQMTVNTKL